MSAIFDEAIDAYHANPAVSHSKLRFFAHNFPATYKAKYIDKTISEETSPALTFGSFFHALALEGQEAAWSRFAVAPKCDRRTKEGKAVFEAFQAELGSKEVITIDDAKTASDMAASVRRNPTAVALLQKGRAEVTFRHSKIEAMPLQTRPDWWNPEGCELTNGRPYIVDVKTIDNLKANWEHQFFKFGYMLAAAFARSVIADVDGWQGPPPDYLYLVVEKEGTYECEIFRPGEVTLDEARRQNLCDLKRLLHCYQTGEWPGGSTEIQLIDAPEWWQTKTKE